jgi:hypothetical protein
VARPSLADIRAAARTLGADVTAAEAVESLHDAGCETIVLKGATFRRELHADGTLRRYSDVDLLVRSQDVGAAGAALAGLGFALVVDHRDHPTVTEPHAQEWQRPRAPKVDLHWRVPGVDAPAPDAWAVLRARTVAIPLGDTNVRGLDRAGIAFTVALHAAHHGRGSRKPLEDLARALAQFDRETWREAASLAERLDAIDAFAAGLRLSDTGAALADELRLPAVRSAQRALMAASPPGAVGLLRMLETRDQRTRQLRETLFPPRELMRLEYPLARRGPRGLAAAHGVRLLVRAVALPAAIRAVRSARREARAPLAEPAHPRRRPATAPS